MKCQLCSFVNLAKICCLFHVTLLLKLLSCVFWLKIVFFMMSLNMLSLLSEPKRCCVVACHWTLVTCFLLNFKICSTYTQVTRERRQETEDRRCGTGGMRQTMGGRRWETENRRQEIGEGDGRWETGDRRQETGFRRKKIWNRRQETKDARLETGDMRQETEMGDR